MSNFLQAFIFTYTEMDHQFRKILDARKFIFANDTSPTLAPPNFNSSEVVEEICWDREGADIAVAFSPVDLPADTPFCTCHFTVTLSLKPVPTYNEALDSIQEDLRMSSLEITDCWIYSRNPQCLDVRSLFLLNLGILDLDLLLWRWGCH